MSYYILFKNVLCFFQCVHCEKSFLNSMFLQSHMQRRHPEEYQSRKSESRVRVHPMKWFWPRILRFTCGALLLVPAVLNLKLLFWNWVIWSCNKTTEHSLTDDQTLTTNISVLNVLFFCCLFTELRSDSENKSVIENLRTEISSQKEQITQLQQTLQAKTAQVGLVEKTPKNIFYWCQFSH